jgi:hypothetical protein
MVEYWYPYDGHPDGESDIAWFRVCEGRGFRAPGNPAGQSDAPCFTVIDGWAYPCLSMPGDPPTFQIIGSFVYAPTGTAWFRIHQAGVDRPAPMSLRATEREIAGMSAAGVEHQRMTKHDLRCL